MMPIEKLKDLLLGNKDWNFHSQRRFVRHREYPIN